MAMEALGWKTPRGMGPSGCEDTRGPWSDPGTAGERLRMSLSGAKLKGVPAANPQTLWQHEQGEVYPGRTTGGVPLLLTARRTASWGSAMRCRRGRGVRTDPDR